jgi:hypothetical protein
MQCSAAKPTCNCCPLFEVVAIGLNAFLDPARQALDSSVGVDGFQQLQQQLAVILPIQPSLQHLLVELLHHSTKHTVIQWV